MSSATSEAAARRSPPATAGGFLRHLGPGFIITATIVGSGELIVTPKLGASVGFSLLWFIVLGCAVKVFVQIALARHAITTGQTTLSALDGLPGPRWRVSWVLWLWALMYVGIVLQIGGIVGGIAGVFAELGVGGGPRAWALPVGVACAALLSTGRYGPVERLSTVMVTAFVCTTVVSVIALAWTPYALTVDEVVSGLRFELPDTFTVAFAAFGVIGVGATELIYYPYWCLEKGYAREIGPTDGTAAWLARARGWLRVMHADAWLSLVVYTTITAAFYLLGAAVLHRQGLDVQNADLVATLSHMYRAALGEWSIVVFLVGAFVVLFSTFFVATASNARLLVDATVLFGLLPAAGEDRRLRRVRVACIALAMLSTVVYLYWPQPVTLVLIGATGQALMLPFLGYAALHFRRVETSGLPRHAAGSVFLWLSALAMAVLGAYQVTQLF